MALIAYGCYDFYYWSPDGMRTAIGGWEPLGRDFPISWSLLVSLVFFIAGATFVWWSVNHPRLVDFFADTEVEMTKVSWSSRKEVFGSSVVVIVTVVILGIWISLVDFILAVEWGDLMRAAFRRIFG
jgi:preprotein translocase SecE subunit